MDKKNIGKFLKELRTEKRLTQMEFSLQFSKFCGIDAYGGFSCAAISKWERGEALPDLCNLKDLAKYYGVTINEILEGHRHISVDYEEQYFGEFKRKERERFVVCSDNSRDWTAKERYFAEKKFCDERDADLLKIQMRAEDRYRRLLLALAHNSISRTDEDEFDYLCLSYFKQYYCFNEGKQTVKSFDVNNCKYMKIEIKKLANSLSPCSDEELLFEINRRYCVCNFMPMERISGVIGKRFSDNRHAAINLSELWFGLNPIYFEFVKSLSHWDKDALLAAILENVYHNVDEDDPTDYLEDYSESIAKDFIKTLIQCGATVNHAIKYKQVCGKTQYIVQELAELHQTYYAPTVVYVESQKQYVETRHYSCEFGDPILTSGLKLRYAEFEKRLLSGENELEPHEIINGKSIYDIAYCEYMCGRDDRLTQELYENIDVLSVEEIKNEYFVEKETA